MSTDWLESTRQGKLDRGILWRTIFLEDTTDADGKPVPKWKAWGIPEDVFTDFIGKVDRAEAALAAAKNTKGNKVVDEECRAAITGLEAAFRFIKGRFLKIPPLSSADFAALSIRERGKPNPVPVPTGQCEAIVEYVGPHVLRLRIRPLAGTPQDPRANHGYRYYWGILPPGGASVEEATGKGRYLMKAPISGEELPHDDYTSRKNKLLDELFTPEDSGKRVYFCVRYQNSKGKLGPWGPIFSAIIP